MGKTHPTGGKLKTIRIVSVPIDLVTSVHNVLKLPTRAIRWHDQTAIESHAQSRVVIPERSPSLAAIASELAKISQIHFDIEQWSPHRGGERYLFVPGLGIKRLELDTAGEIAVRSGSLEVAVQESAGSVIELRRRIDQLLGKPWLALLEPLQTVSESPRLALFTEAGRKHRAGAN